MSVFVNSFIDTKWILNKEKRVRKEFIKSSKKIPKKFKKNYKRTKIGSKRILVLIQKRSIRILLLRRILLSIQQTPTVAKLPSIFSGSIFQLGYYKNCLIQLENWTTRNTISSFATVDACWTQLYYYITELYLFIIIRHTKYT